MVYMNRVPMYCDVLFTILVVGIILVVLLLNSGIFLYGASQWLQFRGIDPIILFPFVKLYEFAQVIADVYYPALVSAALKYWYWALLGLVVFHSVSTRLWTAYLCRKCLIPLALDSSEVERIRRLFHKTKQSQHHGVQHWDGDDEVFEHFDIVNVFRVENAPARAAYAEQRTEILNDSHNRPVGASAVHTMPFADGFAEFMPGELLLFHGCGSRQAMRSICAHGFDPDFANPKSAFGAAAYFAESPSKSNQYVAPRWSEEKLKWVLLVRVTVGVPAFEARYRSGLLRPQCEDTKCDPTQVASCSHTQRHSVVGPALRLGARFREFVVYNAQQACPLYAVGYYRKHN